MKICCLEYADAMRLERDGVTPSCARHDHIPLCTAESGIANERLRWVGEGERRVTKTPVRVWKPTPTLLQTLRVWQMVDCAG